MRLRDAQHIASLCHACSAAACRPVRERQQCLVRSVYKAVQQPGADLVDLVVAQKLAAPAFCQHLGDGSSEGCLAMINVANGPDVQVRLVAGIWIV